MRNLCKNCEINKYNNNIMHEQAKRIVELKKEVNDLSIEIENFKKKEEEITQVLIFAREKANEIIQEAKIKNALECERLKIYRNKWLRYIDEKGAKGQLAEDIEKTNHILRECQIELEDMLYNDLDIDKSVCESYICERERIDDEPSLDYKAILQDTKDTFDKQESLSDEELQKMISKLKK